MFSGSIATGDVLAVDVVTGESHLVVDAPPGRTAAGLEQDRWGRLWVAGGPTGQAYVYSMDGAPAATLSLGPPPSTFINDVVITADAAWFTDSFDDVLYKIPIGRDGTLGPPEAVPSPAATSTPPDSTSTESRPPRATAGWWPCSPTPASSIGSTRQRAGPRPSTWVGHHWSTATASFSRATSCTSSRTSSTR
jgi:hypothetical protein